MNHYQQQYFGVPPVSNPSAPIQSAFYAARQRFEQSSQTQSHTPFNSSSMKSSNSVPTPPHLRSNAMDYKQYSRPPIHPQQQERQVPHTQPQQGSPAIQYPPVNLYQPAYPYQSHSQPQAQISPQSQSQGRPQTRPRSYSTYGQYPVPSQTICTPAPQSQRTYSYPQAQTFPQVNNTLIKTPAPVNDTFSMLQQPLHKDVRPLTPGEPPAYPLHQPPQTSDYYGRPFGTTDAASSAKAAIASSYPSQDQQNQPLARPPTVGSRRPLPQPRNNASQNQARPLSMPPQAFTNYQPPSIISAHTFGHSPSLSLSSVVAQPSPAPSSTSVSPAPGTTSPARRPLPSTSSSPSGPGNGIQGAKNTQPMHESSVGKVLAASSESSSAARITTRHRGFSTPTATIQQAPRESGVSKGGGSVSALVSPMSGSDSHTQVPSIVQTNQGGASMNSPKNVTSPPRKTYIPRSYVRSTTLPLSSTSSSQAISPSTSSVAPSLIESDDEQDGLSTFKPVEVGDKDQVPSPKYGIRDLPKRGERLGSYNFPSTTKVLSVETPKPEPASPQYGIRDLPARTKSVVDRRKAWEKAEQGINESLKGSGSTVLCGSRTQPSSPTKQQARPVGPSRPATSSSSVSTTLTRPSPVVTPSRSPQPQTPKQEQKLPMPAIRHPKPTHTERKLSWTLPNADLDKLTSGKKDEQKMSMAFRFAALSLAEENNSMNGSKITEKTPDIASKPSETSSSLTNTHQRPSSQISSRTNTSSRSGSSIKSYPFSTPRRPVSMDLSLDDAPPPSLRRSPSPSSSNTSSIPTIRTPEDTLSGNQPSSSATPSIPKINIPGDLDFDFESGSITNPPSQVPAIVISPKPTSPRKVDIPVINIPGGDNDDDDAQPSGPLISVSTPDASTAASRAVMPVILSDLANNSSSKARGLPHVPGAASVSTISTTSSSGSNLRSRGGGLICGGCNESIIGRIVSAMGLRWHPQCFKCCVCGEHLEHVSSYEHEGKPYCHLDYHELFAPQCYHCKTPIIDERFITLDDPALGKRTYHEQHFFCAECGDPFLAPSPAKPRRPSGKNGINIKGDGAFDLALDEDGEEVGFTVYRGHPYCEACHVRLRSPKCKGCKKAIRDGMRAVEALGGKWCFECFVCAGCQKPFEEPSFFQRDKKPFCEPCFSIILRNEL